VGIQDFFLLFLFFILFLGFRFCIYQEYIILDIILGMSE